jgi:hypothetical protein
MPSDGTVRAPLLYVIPPSKNDGLLVDQYVITPDISCHLLDEPSRCAATTSLFSNHCII